MTVPLLVFCTRLVGIDCFRLLYFALQSVFGFGGHRTPRSRDILMTQKMPPYVAERNRGRYPVTKLQGRGKHESCFRNGGCQQVLKSVKGRRAFQRKPV